MLFLLSMSRPSVKMHFFLDAGSKECGKRFDVIFGRRSPSLGEPASSSCSWLGSKRKSCEWAAEFCYIHDSFLSSTDEERRWQRGACWSPFAAGCLLRVWALAALRSLLAKERRSSRCSAIFISVPCSVRGAECRGGRRGESPGWLAGEIKAK